MNAAATSRELIEVEDLRIGMFIHLDMSWMSHPFPLGSFKIANAEQIATIRSLGVQRVRWSPAQSDAPTETTGWGRGSDFDRLGATAEPATSPAAPEAVLAPELSSEPVPELVPTAQSVVDSPEFVARQRHKRALAEQRTAQLVCERQFAEAARDCKHLTELVQQKPKDARAQAEQLAKALVDKMLVDQDMCIRLLSEAAGDKAAMHAMNVTVISLLMGRSFGLPAADMADLGVGALLHDIGKLELPDRVRHRDDQFSGAELRFYEEHVAQGVGHARKMGLSPGATMVIAQHHEHADGSGFPLRVNTDRMTPAARIVALVNRYDNLCNPHHAAKALTPHEALSLLFAQGRAKFDTAVLGAFIRMMGVYPAGSTVQLTDDRYAMVVSVNSSRPLKPRVLVHDAKVPRDEAVIVDLETSQGLGIRRSIKPLQMPLASLEYLAPRPRVAYFFEAAVASTLQADAVAA
ncbi:MAG: HD domain-containing phosphohydrolase [Burkholderiales bacterium]